MRKKPHPPRLGEGWGFRSETDGLLLVFGVDVLGVDHVTILRRRFFRRSAGASGTASMLLAGRLLVHQLGDLMRRLGQTLDTCVHLVEATVLHRRAQLRD